MHVYEEKYKLELPQSHGRSEGLHISEVIRDYALNSKVLDRKWISTLTLEEQNTNLMQVGLAWEDYLAKFQHVDIEYHPGELCQLDKEFCECRHGLEAHNGKRKCGVRSCDCCKFRPMPIYMSPDGISLIDADDYADLFVLSSHFLHEFKFTKKSSRDFLKLLRMRSKKTLMYQWQIMCYCKAMGTLAAKLHVMFINGNYSRQDDDPENSPSYKIFRLEFTQEEIDENWEMFRNHARSMVQR